MYLEKSLAVVVALSVSFTLLAQHAATSRPAGQVDQQLDGETPAWIRAETPEQRRDRLGTNDDPGVNPDPKKVWSRFGKRYRIEKFDRRWSRDTEQAGIVRPFAFVNITYELYQQNEKWVWVWIPVEEENAEPPPPPERFTPEGVAYLKKIAPEHSVLTPPDANRTVRFLESSEGLPTSGSWRNSLAVADMNNDGNPDIIVPPQRGTATIPAIFLGDGKGRWKIWSTVIWPYAIQYGGVAAADFNNDRNMDLAFAIHLVGVRVFLGDGKGTFVDASKGLTDHDYPTRRVVAADLDRDGFTDLLTISEGPTMRAAGGDSRVRAYINRKKGREWERVDAVGPERHLAGDWLAVGKFNGDKYPDFVGSSNYFSGHELLYLSRGPKKWEAVKNDGAVIPYLSYYWAVATGRFGSSSRDDAILAYSRSWPSGVDPAKVAKAEVDLISGIDRISFASGEPKRFPVVRFASTRPLLGLAAGDVDGDGKTDLVYSGWDPREFTVLLGDGKGGFARAMVEGLKAEQNTNYDLTLADVNHDGRLDVLVPYESAAESRFGLQDGSIRVFLNQGSATRDRAPAR